MPTKYQLKNGMNVLLIESHKSPVVAVQMWVKTGSADETKGNEGISHFIEHLVFKGSEKYGVGGIASAVEGAGGVLNAYTTFDQTVFYVTVSKAFADTGLDVISEMMGRPKFDESEIDNEREVVIEEIKRSLDNPHQVASRLLFSTAYKQHPYGVPVIGYDDNIRRVTKDEILKYYNSRYVPQNMNLVIVGDFKTPEMKKKIETYFGGFKKYKLQAAKRATEPKQKSLRVAVKETKFAESFLYLSWPVPSASHDDALALSLVSLILGQGESSRLVSTVRNQMHVVSSVGASVFTPKEPGFFAVSSVFNKEKLKDATTAIAEEIEKFILNGPTAQEVSKAIRQLESEQYYSMETVDGLAGLYGYFEFLHEDYKYFEKALKKTSRLKPADLVRVAKKYLTAEAMSVTYLTNEDSASSEKWLTNWAEKILSKTAKASGSAKKPSAAKTSVAIKWRAPKSDKVLPAEIINLSGGAKMIIKSIKGSPVVSLRAGFLGGLRYEGEKALGVNELASRVWPTASLSLDETELNKKIESMASGIGAFGGRNSLGLSMTSLVPNLEKSYEIFEDLILHPRLDEEVIRREKNMMKEHIRTRSDKPAQKCMLSMLRLVFDGHPYARDPFGDAESVDRLTKTELKKYLSKVVTNKNLIFSVVGDLSSAKWQRAFEKVASKLGAPAQADLSHNMPSLKKSLASYEYLDKEQSHICLVYRGLTFLDKDRLALDVMQSILSGQGGRLFVELRDKASLAYTVSPMRMDGIEPGYFGAYIGCSPEKGKRAVEMMQEEFNKLRTQKVLRDEIDRAKRYLLGRHDIALQRTGQVADLMLFDQMYGLKFNEFEKFQKNLESVTAEQIQSVAERIFSGPSVLSVVGRENVSF
jgi:zinc protease